MPIEINLPCKCPHCGEEFELFQSLAQDVLETVQTRLLAADTQGFHQGLKPLLPKHERLSIKMWFKLKPK